MTQKELQKAYNEALIAIIRPSHSKFIKQGRGKKASSIRYVRLDMVIANTTKMTLAVDEYLRSQSAQDAKKQDSTQERNGSLSGFALIVDKVLRSLKLRR